MLVLHKILISSSKPGSEESDTCRCSRYLPFRAAKSDHSFQTYMLVWVDVIVH